jgi:WD40 repeat protein
MATDASIGNAVEFSPDGQRVLTTSFDETAWLLNVNTGKKLAALGGHEQPINFAQFNPDGTRVVTASQDGTARLWDAARITSSIVALDDGKVVALKLAMKNDRALVSMHDDALKIWDVSSKSVLLTLDGINQEQMKWAAFDADGRRIVVASREFGIFSVVSALPLSRVTKEHFGQRHSVETEEWW